MAEKTLLEQIREHSSQHPDELYCPDLIDGYVRYWHGDDTILLDGHYAAEELTALADYMRETRDG